MSGEIGDLALQILVEQGKERLQRTIQTGVDPKGTILRLEVGILERFDRTWGFVPVRPAILTRVEIFALHEARKTEFCWGCRSCGAYGSFRYVVGDLADFDRQFLRVRLEHIRLCDAELCCMMED